MAKDTNFKFGKHAPRQSPDTTLKKILEKGHSQDHVTLIFGR